jgi:hypothetical protein
MRAVTYVDAFYAIALDDLERSWPGTYTRPLHVPHHRSAVILT